MNFGVVSMYIGFLLLGLLGFTANELSKKRKYDFFSTYLVVQYFHCISGGIANVMIPVLLMLIVYFAIHIFSYKGVKKYEQ